MDAAIQLLNKSNRIIVTAGAGLSAAGGASYVDSVFFKDHYPYHFKLGFKTIWETVGNYWVISPQNEQFYWGFWAWHINTIRYQLEVLQPYKDLKAFLAGKNYFIATTNVDHQFFKAGFESQKIWAMQGNYGLFQCQDHCTDEVYDNYEFVQKMIQSMNADNMTVDKSTIPHCPHCGKYLVPNLRSDDTFVETPHMANLPLYQQFIKESESKDTVFLELGVGYNSPGALRFPVERLVYYNPTFKLVRVNINDCDCSPQIASKTILVEGDIAKFLHALAQTK